MVGKTFGAVFLGHLFSLIRQLKLLVRNKTLFPWKNSQLFSKRCIIVHRDFKWHSYTVLLLKAETSKSQLRNGNRPVVHACCLKRARCLLANLHSEWPLLEMCYKIKASQCLWLQEILLFLFVSSFPLSSCLANLKCFAQRWLGWHFEYLILRRSHETSLRTNFSE